MKSNINWAKVWSIAGLQSAITLTWVIYNLYFTSLLVQFGFSKELASIILIIENGLEVAIEPIFGNFSDRQQNIFGSRMKIINRGVILSSILFIAIPLIVIFINPNHIFRWILPILAILWASAMAIFRSPLMSLLRQASTNEDLPKAVSIVTLVSAIIGTFRFDVYGLIIKMGVGFAFTVGSIALLGGMAIVRYYFPPQTLESDNEIINHNLDRTFKYRLFLIFCTGITVGWTIRFLSPTIKLILSDRFPDNNIKLLMTLFFLVLGIASIPAGEIGTKLGNSKGMLLGASLIIIAISLLNIPTISLLTILFLILSIAGYSLLLNSPIPFVLNLVPSQNSGLGIGMYFGGLGGGISFFDLFFKNFINKTQAIGSIGTILSLLLTIILIIKARSIEH